MIATAISRIRVRDTPVRPPRKVQLSELTERPSELAIISRKARVGGLSGNINGGLDRVSTMMPQN